MTTLNKVIDKIQKLKRLATSPNEHEATRAAAAAAALMARFNLEEAQILAETATEDEPIAVDRVVERSRNKVQWRGIIAAGLARTLNCEMYWRGGNIMLIGREQDARAVAYLLGLITREVSRLASEKFLDAVGEDELEGRWKASFRLGCASMIRQRLEEEARVRELKRDGSSMALMVLDKRALKVKDLHSKMDLRKGRRVSVSHSSAYYAGQKAGRDVDLSRGGRAVGALNGARKEVTHG